MKKKITFQGTTTRDLPAVFDNCTNQEIANTIIQEFADVVKHDGENLDVRIDLKVEDAE